MLSSQQPHFPPCVNIDLGVKFTSEREAQTNIKERLLKRKSGERKWKRKLELTVSTRLVVDVLVSLGQMFQLSVRNLSGVENRVGGIRFRFDLPE